MSDLQTNLNLSSADQAIKTSVMIGYGLMILGMFTGFFWIISVIWAMFKKEEAAGSIFADHYSNIINTFWWVLGLSILGFMLAFVIAGYFILLGLWIWSTYRIIKGLARITSNKSFSN